MGTNVTTCSIRVPSIQNDKFYRIRTIWQEYNFSMTILDKDSAFQTNVVQNQLENWAKQYELPFNKYFDVIYSSLTGDTEKKYVFERNTDGFFISLRENNITVRLANFKLEKVDFIHAVEDFIDDITKTVLFYKIKLSDCEKESAVYLSEKNEYAKKLEEYACLKEEAEQELYSKFILILNEKKQRIQYLQEMLDAYKSGKVDSEKDISDDEISAMEVGDELSASISKKREDISDSDSEESNVNYFEMQTQVQVKSDTEEKSFLADEVIPSISGISIRKNVVKEISTNEIAPSNNKPVENKEHENILISDVQNIFNSQDLLETL